MSKGSLVKSQMPGTKIPGMKGAPGVYDHDVKPFDKPHDVGKGGIPLKIYEDHGVKIASTKITGTVNSGLASSTGRGQQGGGSSRPVVRSAPPSNKK